MIKSWRMITACPISCSIAHLEKEPKNLRLSFSSRHKSSDLKIDRSNVWRTFGGFFSIGLRFTPLGKPSRLFARCVTVCLQIIVSRHHLIHASTPRAFLVSTCYSQSIGEKTRMPPAYLMQIMHSINLTFLALLLNSLGLLAGLVALLEVQSARPQISIRVAFRPLTLYVSARRGAGGCCVSRCETSIETIGRNVDQASRERERILRMMRTDLINPVVYVYCVRVKQCRLCSIKLHYNFIEEKSNGLIAERSTHFAL